MQGFQQKQVLALACMTWLFFEMKISVKIEWVIEVLFDLLIKLLIFCLKSFFAENDYKLKIRADWVIKKDL